MVFIPRSRARAQRIPSSKIQARLHRLLDRLSEQRQRRHSTGSRRDIAPARRPPRVLATGRHGPQRALLRTRLLPLRPPQEHPAHRLRGRRTHKSRCCGHCGAHRAVRGEQAEREGDGEPAREFLSRACGDEFGIQREEG